VHPFYSPKLFFLVVQAPISRQLQIQGFAESCQCHLLIFLALGRAAAPHKRVKRNNQYLSNSCSAFLDVIEKAEHM